MRRHGVPRAPIMRPGSNRESTADNRPRRLPAARLGHDEQPDLSSQIVVDRRRIRRRNPRPPIDAKEHAVRARRYRAREHPRVVTLLESNWLPGGEVTHDLHAGRGGCEDMKPWRLATLDAIATQDQARHARCAP